MSAPPQAGAGPIAPTRPSQRLLAPDLARGVMLLLIALAHSRQLHAGGNSLTTPAGGSTFDVAVQWLLTTFVDGRAAPLFGILFGYGLVQMTRRYMGPEGDPKQARQLIRRRGVWLIVFGAAHVILLYSGDIIGAYGAFAVMFAGVISWSTRRLWTVMAITLVFGVAAAALLQLVTPSNSPLAVGPTLFDSALLRSSALAVLPIAAVSMAPSVLIGVLAARMRLLEEPDRFRPLLRRFVLIGFPVSALGAQPVALQALGLWTPGNPGIDAAALALFAGTGIAGGLAFLALIALVAYRLQDRRGLITTALVACGRRSMTFYIAQSLVWVTFTEPSLLDLGGKLGAATAAGLAVVTWVITVVIAYALDRTGRRGPFEALLRHLTYRNSPRRQPAAPLNDARTSDLKRKS
ncbi:DUF418 domain-containing protein [Microbacterium sp. SA39]|uniref:DUF418 domain-containing protein n=1 Tax=Microbacterium sp. SA39 TaxID=1263625 RepID=UPI00061EF258|nr:DUF418 domain-containing protein [Microbacterium sp. SA39]KJQ52722.1 hypothetical protein RS85_03616 [Microbacterium sp. SA39]